MSSTRNIREARLVLAVRPQQNKISLRLRVTTKEGTVYLEADNTETGCKTKIFSKQETYELRQ